MGLSASQARLLSLTARMHDIEYKAQNLEAQKLQMANKSQQVYAEYEDALNRTTVQYKTIGADGSAAYKDATLKALVTATGEAKSDYIAHNIATNQMYCTQAQITAFIQASTATKPGASAAVGTAETVERTISTFKFNTSGNYIDANGDEILVGGRPVAKTAAAPYGAVPVTYKANASGNYVSADGTDLGSSDPKTIPTNAVVVEDLDRTIVSVTDTDYAAQKFAEIMGWAESGSLQALYNEMLECVKAHNGDASKAFIGVDISDGKYAPNADEAQQFNNSVYLTNMLQSGFIVLHKMTGDGVTAAAEEINIAVDTSLQEVSNELDLKKAEAKYEADMRKINAKDKKFDVDIAALEQERNAIKTEMDTLKTVAKDNVERTFKLFS